MNQAVEDARTRLFSVAESTWKEIQRKRSLCHYPLDFLEQLNCEDSDAEEISTFRLEKTNYYVVPELPNSLQQTEIDVVVHMIEV